MKKLLGFLYVMLLSLMMAGPAFAGDLFKWWSNGCDWCSGGGCPSQSIPEPSTMILLGTGILALAVYGRKMIKK